jgi:hypothetical protein
VVVADSLHVADFRSWLSVLPGVRQAGTTLKDARAAILADTAATEAPPNAVRRSTTPSEATVVSINLRKGFIGASVIPRWRDVSVNPGAA